MHFHLIWYHISHRGVLPTLLFPCEILNRHVRQIDLRDRLVWPSFEQGRRIGVVPPISEITWPSIGWALRKSDYFGRRIVVHIVTYRSQSLHRWLMCVTRLGKGYGVHLVGLACRVQVVSLAWILLGRVDLRQIHLLVCHVCLLVLLYQLLLLEIVLLAFEATF